MKEIVGIKHHYPKQSGLLAAYLYGVPLFGMVPYLLHIALNPWVAMIVGIFGVGWVLQVVGILLHLVMRVGYETALDDISRLGLAKADFIKPPTGTTTFELLEAVVRTLDGKH